MRDFNTTECQIMVDIIDIWVLGVADAKDLTTEDPTIDSPEELLDLMSGYDDDLATLSSIRTTLKEVLDAQEDGAEGRRNSR